MITIDRGTKDHVQTDDGVMTGDGVVGRVDRSRPALVESAADQRSDQPSHRASATAAAGGRSRSARSRASSCASSRRMRSCTSATRVVTGEGRSFRAGVPIGRIVAARTDGRRRARSVRDRRTGSQSRPRSRGCSSFRSNYRSIEIVSGPEFWRAAGWVVLGLFVQTVFAPLLVVRGGIPSFVTIAVVLYALRAGAPARRAARV